MKGNIFIKRPVMAISISILILVVGLISLFSLPVEQYPNIAPPTVNVSATYTGADANAVMNSVIMPLEESINGVENMMYITSTATNAGTATIEVFFKQGTDPDMAAVNVQNRVSKAQGLLPAEVTKIGVSTQKRQTSFLQIDALVCDDGRYDQTFLANYLDINIIPQIKRIEGVGDVMMLGDAYSMRIWLKPDRMAQYGLVPSDVTAASVVYLPASPKEGQVIFVKQWWRGYMRFRPRSGYLIYDDTSVNDYYDFGEGQGGMFVYTVGYVDGVKKQAWLVSRWKY